MLSRINALTLVHTLSRHYYSRFASMDDHLYATCQLPPLFLCHHLFGRAKEFGKSFLAGLTCWCPKILVSSHLLWGDIPVKWLPHFSLELVACVCFLVFPTHWFCFRFFSKTSHILLLLQRGLFLKFETIKKESFCKLSTVRLFFLKTPLMVDFAFLGRKLLLFHFSLLD